MKKRTRILGVTLLMAIYCFAVSALMSVPIDAGHDNHQSAGQASYLATVSYSLFSHTSQAEILDNSFSNVPVPDFKNPFGERGLINKSLEQLFEAKFVQYNGFLINVLIHDRKADLIFPFHYFW